MAKNYEISVYFSTNAIVALCHAPPYFEIQNALVSKRRTLLSWKVLTDINLVPLMPDEDKAFNGSLVLNLRI